MTVCRASSPRSTGSRKKGASSSPGASAVDGAGVRSSYQEVLDGMRTLRARGGWLGEVATTFLKVTANYGEALFQCYDMADLPATNNDLERRFGTLRYHERRCSGRRAVSGGLVLRGAVRVVTVLSAERLKEEAE